MGKVRGHTEETVGAQHRPMAPDVVTAGAPLGEGDGGSVPSVRERLRSRDLAVKVFVAGATYVALVWINKAWAVIGAVLSPIVSDLVRDFVERHHWSLRRLRRGSAATVLLGHEEEAYASRKRAGARAGRPDPGGLMASAAAVALVAVAHRSGEGARQGHPDWRIPISRIITARLRSLARVVERTRRHSNCGSAVARTGRPVPGAGRVPHVPKRRTVVGHADRGCVSSTRT